MPLFQVIKYDGSKDNLVYKYPAENMNTKSKLIVNGFQEAVFVKNGKILDVLPQGSYSLSTDIIPLLSSFINLPYGGRTPFTAEVFFVNKLSILGIKWGSLTPLQVKDPKYDVVVPVRSYGEFGMSIADSRLFMESLIGNTQSFSTADLLERFKGIVCAKINDLVASYVHQSQTSVLELNANLRLLSDAVIQGLQPVFADYGINFSPFNIIATDVPEDNPSVKALKTALAKKATMNVVGFDYDKERTYNALENAAKNPGSGDFVNVGMGVPMGMAMGEFLKNSLQMPGTGTAAAPSQVAAGAFCPHCGKPVTSGVSFCSSCGGALAPAKKSCPSCSSQVEGAAAFCSSCGAKV